MDERAENSGGINPFVTNLSSLSIFFSFSYGIFTYAIVVYLQYASISVLFVGVGIMIGELLRTFTAFVQGRYIDKGYSFAFMLVGSLLYGFFLVLTYFLVSNPILPYITIPLIIAGILIFEGMFRAALNTFIAKAVAGTSLGKNYSRVYAADTAGTAISYVFLLIGILSSNLGFVFLGSGILLSLIAIAVFFLLRRKDRDTMIRAEATTPRPGFGESLRRMKSLRRFIVPLVTSKGFMTLGVLGFSLFYVVSGLYLGLSPIYTYAVLLGMFALSTLFGKFGEKFVDLHDWGKRWVIYAMALDVVTYSVLLYSIFSKNEYLFLAGAFIQAPGTLFVAGMLSFEVAVIGKENRGMFSGIQRQVVGLLAAFGAIPLAYLYRVDPIYLWMFMLAASLAALTTSLMLPGEGVAHPKSERLAS